MALIVAGGVLAWVLALVLTPLMRSLATRRGWVCTPRADRWSTRTVALMGGVAIVAATAAGSLVLIGRFDARTLSLLGASLLMAVVGVVDDRLTIRPHTKLIAQVVAAVWLVEAGLRFGLVGRFELIDQLLTIFWIVAIGNALNLLDNMDGLCAGVAAIGAAFLTVIHASGRDYAAATLTASLCGACLGYLRYNRHPATIFMGDGGSLFIGCLLAGASLIRSGTGASRSMLSVIALPVLVMLIPLMDTILVTAARTWAGRPISQGGRDHSSHRLVAIGLSEPAAVKLLYSLAIAGGLAALAVRYLDWYLSSLLLPVLLLGVGSLVWYLGRVRVYEEETDIGQRLDQTWVPLLANHRYRRRIAEVVLDTICVAAGFYTACVLRYEDALAQPALLDAFVRSLPLVIACHLVAYFIAGVYRGIWRYTSVSDLPRFVRAVSLALLLSAITLAISQRLGSLSRSLFVINWLVQLALLAGTRLSLKLLRDSLTGTAANARPVLVVGLGEAAELELRRLRAAGGDCRVLGTLCENRDAIGRQLLDTPIVGTSEDIRELLAAMTVTEVVLLDEDYPAPCWERIRQACAEFGIPTRVVKNRIELDSPLPPRPASAVV